MSSTGNEMNAPWSQRIKIEPPKPNGRGEGILSSRIAHVNTQGAITPAEARQLASVLLELADECERLDEQAIPHLEAYLRAVAADTASGSLAPRGEAAHARPPSRLAVSPS